MFISASDIRQGPFSIWLTVLHSADPPTRPAQRARAQAPLRGNLAIDSMPSSPSTLQTVQATCSQWLARAVRAHQTGAFKQAEQTYRQLLAACPEEADGHHNLGCDLTALVCQLWQDTGRHRLRAATPAAS